MQNTGKNTQKHRAIVAACFGICALFFMLISTPASAQSPTVTPIPGPVATATAAANRVQQAQQQQSQAAELQRQADAAQQAAQQAYQQAQADAAAAREALAAQQYQAAGEALGRADANIAAGQGQIDALSASYAALRGIVDQQAQTILRQEDDLTSCRASVSNYSAAFEASQRQLDQAKAEAVNPGAVAIGGLIFLFLIGILVIFVAAKWRRIEVIQTRAEVIDAETIDPP